MPRAIYLITLLSLSTAFGAQRGILTPPPPAEPRINGPAVYGVHPGHPFLYLIPATGDRPIKFSVDGLPRSLHVDPKTGILSGVAPPAGNYRITLRARNHRGAAHKQFDIISGDKLALTPPMGWSTWYMAFSDISDRMVRAQADAMVASGLVNHGYSYVDIDDGWNIKPPAQGKQNGEEPRDASGNLRPNAGFPDMQALADYVHRQGLKIGIYSSPGPRTCGGFEGSYGHEQQDARLFAQWGFDLLKYDLCSYGKFLTNRNDPEQLKRPYREMGSILTNLNRDVVYNLCEYGLGEVWKWGREVGGNFWRTTGDIGSAPQGLWKSMSSIGFGESDKARWAGPGGWNDPDNILIGYILWNHRLMPTPLTHNEQYSYVTLWSLLDSPLMFGGDMTRLDDFTLNLLTNDEVIAVNQDALGKQAVPVYRAGGVEVWAKDLEDGSKAIGLFNRGEDRNEGDGALAGSWHNGAAIRSRSVERERSRQGRQHFFNFCGRARRRTRFAAKRSVSFVLTSGIRWGT